MPGWFEYQNPIYTEAYPFMRDAQIVRLGAAYYMTGTVSSYSTDPPTDQSKISLFVSRDLKDWKLAAVLLDRKDIPSEAWYTDCFWAPEVHAIAGRFYLTFTAKNRAKGSGFGVGLAVADAITGPYEVLSKSAPLWGGIDLSLMADDDGKVYGFWTAKGIRAAEIDLEKARVVGDLVLCAEKVPGTWEDRVIEGPFGVKRGGLYYVFYSCGARGYEVGYATAERPLGPWRKWEGNPLFGVQCKEACDKMGMPFEGDPDHPLLYAGHNAIFTGPDGGDWTSYLIQAKGRSEQLGIDPIRFKDGRIETPAPTWTPQRVALP